MILLATCQTLGELGNFFSHQFIAVHSGLRCSPIYMAIYMTIYMTMVNLW